MEASSESDGFDPYAEEHLLAMPLLRLVSIAGDHVDRGWHQMLESSELTGPSLGLLLAIAGEDGLSHREAALRSGVSPATITTAGDLLERKGYAERRRTDTDRRVVRLWITDEGREVSERMRVLIAAHLSPLAELITGDEERIVRRYLIDLVTRSRREGTA